MRRLAYTVIAVVVVLGVLALFSRGDDGEESVAAPKATPAPATATPAAPTATPTEAPSTPTPAPATATPSPTPSPVATPATPTPTPSPPRILPPSFTRLAAALPEPGVMLTDAFDPVCPGASVEPIVFAGPDSEDGERFAVWVLWPYPDREAFWEQWVINEERRAVSLLDGCEPPNGFVYFNRGLLIWFVGFYGSEVDPGSDPINRAEIRQHPVIRAFLELER